MTLISRRGAVSIGLFVFLAMGISVPGSYGATGANPPPRDAYKYVDEKGKTGYSDLTPPAGSTSEKVDITPANSGKPSPTTRSRSDHQGRSNAAKRDASSEERQAPQKSTDEAKQKEIEEQQAKEKCARYGGQDCPNALTRYPDNQQPLWRTPSQPGRLGVTR